MSDDGCKRISMLGLLSTPLTGNEAQISETGVEDSHQNRDNSTRQEVHEITSAGSNQPSETWMGSDPRPRTSPEFRVVDCRGFAVLRGEYSDDSEDPQSGSDEAPAGPEHPDRSGTKVAVTSSLDSEAPSPQGQTGQSEQYITVRFAPARASALLPDSPTVAGARRTAERDSVPSTSLARAHVPIRSPESQVGGRRTKRKRGADSGDSVDQDVDREPAVVVSSESAKEARLETRTRVSRTARIGSTPSRTRHGTTYGGV